VVKHVDNKNAKKNSGVMLVPGIDTYFEGLVEVPLNEWLKKENRIEFLPEKLRNENFLIEVNKLGKYYKKYLFNLKSSGRTKGSKNKVVIDGIKICNGPICNGKERLVSNFVNSYCQECAMYSNRFGIKTIFNHTTGTSKRRSNKSLLLLEHNK